MEARGQFILGQIFTTHYKMSGKSIQCASTATVIEEGRKLEIRHANCLGEKISPELEVIETVTLQEKNGRTLVTKTVLIKNHDIPWLLRPLIWFITRFGKPTSPNKLIELCR